MSEDLDDIIVSSIEDAETDTSALDDVTPDPTPEAPVEASPEPPEPTTEPVAVESAVPPQPPVDDFEKKFGIAPTSSSGRENRIPYSRVKKISEKAVNDAKALWTKDLEKGYTPLATYQEVEAKVKDYEGRLAQVAEFEKIMTTDHHRFLTMLVGLPGYKEIF